MLGGKFYLYRHALWMKWRSFVRNPASIQFYLNVYIRSRLSGSPENTCVSYPKSGRTWLEAMLVEAMKAEHGLSADELDNWVFLKQKVPSIPLIRFTHACSSWETQLLDENEMRQLKLDPYTSGKTLFLYRDPRDVMVSAYYHIKYRTGVEAVVPDDMIDHPIVGLRKMIAFLNSWRRYCQRHSAQTLAISYEKLRQNPSEQLGRVAEFFGLALSPKAIQQAVDKANFKKMREKERLSDGKNPWVTPADVSDTRSFKVRKGIVGEYKEFFSEDQLTRINSIIKEELDVEFEYT